MRWGWRGWIGGGLFGAVGKGGGAILGSGTAKAKTWTTGEQQAHVHIHHKTSTILYINIWTSSPGGREGWGLGIGEGGQRLGRDGGRESEEDGGR